MQVQTMSLRNQMGTGPELIVPFTNLNNSSGYYIQDIQGLDPGQIQYNTFGGVYTMPGSVVTNNVVFSRNRKIVIKLGLQPFGSSFNSFAACRDNLYRIISAQSLSDVTLTLVGPDDIVYIIAQVTSVEADLFTDKPSCTISMETPGDAIFNSFGGVDLTMPIGQTLEFTDTKSTAPHGCVIELTARTTLPEYNSVIQLLSNFWVFPDIVPDGVINGDQIIIQNYTNVKSIMHKSDARSIFRPIAEIVAPLTTWPVVFPGINTLVAHDDFAWTDMIQNYGYWGV